MTLMKTILVTGVAGFIGSHTAKRLLSEGSRVIGVDNINDYYNTAWKKQNLDQLATHANFTFYEVDILDVVALDEIYKTHQPDAIIHLAARAGVRPSIENPLLYEEVNVRGTLNLLESSRKYGVGKFIYASSSSVYGNQSKVPFSETDVCDTPISPYAATKKATELLAHTYSHLYDIQCIGLRFFTVYGPAGRPDMAPYLFTEAILKGNEIKKFGDGSTARDYTYIDDIVSGVVACLLLDKQYEIINLGNRTPVTLNQFISTLEQITSLKMLIKQYPMQPGDVDQTYSDISKAQRLLGYQPQTSFEKGLEQFVHWFKAHRL